MGATAAVVNAAGAGAGAGAGVSAATSMFISVGVGIGGMVIAAILVFLLAYLNLLDGVSTERISHRKMVVATTVPVGLTFAAVIALQTLGMVA